MEGLILLDTTELLRVMPRKLHAAWAELAGGKALVPPTVANELAPLAVTRGLTGRLSVAEELLQPEAPALDRERREQIRRQAWWAAVWRDPNSPYGRLDLTPDQQALNDTLLANIARECFPTANPALLADNRDTGIVCETIALGGKMLLTSNMRTIDHIRVNEWAVGNGGRFGFHAEPVIFQADDQLVRWTTSEAGRERWIQAGMIASWPARDDADANAVLDATMENIGAIVRRGGVLPNATARLINEIENHPNPVELVERTRRAFPSPTIATDRAHPSYAHTD